MPADMRKTFGGWVAVLGLLVAGSAHAQFANRSLGGGLGFVKLLGGSSLGGSTGVDFAIPLTLEGSLYIDSGFDIYLRIPVMLTESPTGAATASGRGQVYGSGGSLGVRYLLLEACSIEIHV